jgi:predicted nucleic acid-binding protein
MRVLIDTNCLVAAALPQHEHHAKTLADLARRRAAGHTFVMAAHAVLEAYAVLTRLPPPHRLAAADAVAVLDRNWGAHESIALTGPETWRLLRLHAAASLSGGRIYDAAIAACARKGKADEILTWHVRHFAGAQSPVAVTPADR